MLVLGFLLLSFFVVFLGVVQFFVCFLFVFVFCFCFYLFLFMGFLGGPLKVKSFFTSKFKSILNYIQSDSLVSYNCNKIILEYKIVE